MNFVQIGAIAAFCLVKNKNKRRKIFRRWWVHPVLRSRLTTGQFHLKFCEHRKYPQKFFLYYRMTIKSFDDLLLRLYDHIKKSETVMRQPIQRISTSEINFSMSNIFDSVFGAPTTRVANIILNNDMHCRRFVRRACRTRHAALNTLKPT